MNAHTEHRGGEWDRRELYRSTMQALEGRCSTRSNFAKEFEMQIREFTATLECHLIDVLQKRLEELNEPDRLLISRLNRALCELGDSKSTVLSRPTYHMVSPTRPAHRVWTMCTKDPERLKSLVNEVCSMANIPFDNADEKNTCEVKFSALPPTAWSAVDCAQYLVHKVESADDSSLSDRLSRHYSSYRSMKNGYSLMKSSSVISQCSTTSLPTQLPNSKTDSSTDVPDGLDLKPFNELGKTDTNLEESKPNGDLQTDDAAKSQLPLEPCVLVREMRPLSFRESSLTDESDSACALKEEAFNSTSPSAASSSVPAYQTDTSFDSHEAILGYSTLQVPLCEQTTSSCGPSTATSTACEVPQEPIFLRFGDCFLSRPIDIMPLPNIAKTQLLAISDSCGGVYITTTKGEVVQQLPIRDSSASSLAIDLSTWRLLVSVMQSRGRSIHVFDISNRFKKVEVIPCPKEPKIELSRTRWITVSPRGDLFAVSGDNHRSAIWMYNHTRKGWKIVKESKKTRYQYLRVAEDQPEYKAVVLLTCDAAQNRILLFVVDQTGALINEYDLTRKYGLDRYIKNPASAVVDSIGNLLVLDYATGRLWAFLSGQKGTRRLVEIALPTPLGAQEALGIAAHGDWIYITCFTRREIVCVRYLINGMMAPNCTPKKDSSELTRRAISLPRPSRKPEHL